MAIARVSFASIALTSLLTLTAGCGGATQTGSGPETASSGGAETSGGASSNETDKPTDGSSDAAPAKTAEAGGDEPTARKPPEDDTPPARPASISCEPKAGASPAKGPKLALEVDRSKVDLDAHKLEVKLTRPACKVELKVVGESGKMLAEVAKGFDGASPGTVLAVGWTPSRTENVKRIEVWGHDTDGNFVGVAITPWNVKVEHEEVNFETDSDAIRAAEVPKLEASLEKVRDALSTHKDLGTIQLYIAGHTDTVGSPEHNLTLSRKRARAIASWFRSHGLKIPVSYEGFGEHSPAVKTPDETAESKNRRVDYILSLEPPRLPQGAVAFGWKGI
jgi:outer membrane protein OmpA-like peptidoglycan-associated protein